MKPVPNSRPKSPNKTSRKAHPKNLPIDVADALLNSTKKTNVLNARGFKLACVFSATSKTTSTRKQNSVGFVETYNPKSMPKMRKNNNT